MWFNTITNCEMNDKDIRSLLDDVAYDNEEFDELIARDLYWLKYAKPNDGDELGDFVLPKIDYIIWKEEK